MGVKISIVYYMLVSVAMIFQLIGAFIRWHVFSVTLGIVTLMRVHTGLLFTRVDQGLALMCRWNTKWTECTEMAEGVTLQQAASHWCIPLLTDIMGVTAPCSAFNWAYVLGLICTMAIILNFTLLAASIAMLLQYFNSTKHKPEYRQYAFYLHAVATGIIFLTFLAWSFLALPALDHIGASSGYASSGLGVSYGYCLMVVGILFQSVSAALFSFMPLGDEMTEDERMFHKFAKEQAHNAHMAAAQPGQPGPPGPPGQPVGYYGAAPPVPNAAQPGYGYGYGYGPQQGQTPAW